MRFSALVLAALPLLALAAPMEKRQFSPSEDITTAMLNWLQDTGFVSSYLDFAADPNSAPSAIQSNGVQALAAELDELNHKMVLDNYFIFGTNAPNQAVVAASNVLVNQGFFNQVVMGLMDISTTANVADVATINANRCANVLPAIDVYFNAVAVATGATADYAAIRPAACGGVRK